MATIEIKNTDEECIFYRSISSIRMARNTNSGNMILIFDNAFNIEFIGKQTKACKSIYNLIRKYIGIPEVSIYIDSHDGKGWIAEVFEPDDYKPIATSEPDDEMPPQIDFNDISKEVIDKIVEGTAKDVNMEEVTNTDQDGSAKSEDSVSQDIENTNE